MTDSEAKVKIIAAMRMHNIDVVDISLSRGKDGRIYPETRQLSDGTWLPILDWSFVNFDPTRMGFSIMDSC